MVELSGSYVPTASLKTGFVTFTESLAVFEVY